MSRRSDPVRMNDWNDYRMRCVGRRIQLWINGFPTVDYTELDADIDQEGSIAVQVHSGGPMQASYRHIRLKRLLSCRFPRLDRHADIPDVTTSAYGAQSFNTKEERHALCAVHCALDACHSRRDEYAAK